MDKFKRLYRNEMYSDVKITIKYFEDGVEKLKTFPGHSLVLKIASEVFEAMLSGNFAEKDSITIENVDLKIFEIFYKYMYYDVVELSSVSEAWDLYDVGLRFLVRAVQMKSLDYITKHSNIETACYNYNYADFHGLEPIKTTNYNIILNFLPVIFAQAAFLDLGEEAISSILDEDSLLVSEAELFKNLEKWIHAQVNRKGTGDEKEGVRKHLIESLVSKVHYLNMSPSDFADGAGRSDLLSQDQKYSILMNFCSRRPFPLANGISRSENRLKVLNCNCTTSEQPCSLTGLEITALEFNEPKSTLVMKSNSGLGSTGSGISFYFKLNLLNSTTGSLLTCGSETSGLFFKISVESGSLKISYNCDPAYPSTQIVFDNNHINDGRSHSLSVAFSSDNVKISLDNSNSFYSVWKPISYSESIILGSEKNLYGFKWCLSSLDISSLGVVKFQNDHTTIQKVSFCSCDLPEKYAQITSNNP